MSLTPEDVKKIGHLARLNLTDQDIATYTPQLTEILNFIAEMNEANTDNIPPISHSFEVSQRMRVDIVTEENLRDKFQDIAPQVEAGLYLVPKVIEEA